MATGVEIGLNEITRWPAWAVHSPATAPGERLPFWDTPETLDANYLRPDPDLTMLPKRERPIIARSLASYPEDRWPSCRELMVQMAKVVSGEP
jgi:hypothetical protein